MRRAEVSSAHRDLLQSKRMMRRVAFIDVPSTVNQQVVFRQIVLRKSRAPLRSVKFEKLVIERTSSKLCTDAVGLYAPPSSSIWNQMKRSGAASS